MQMHTIQPKHSPRRARRIGRGGKRGTFSGRGVKGQKAHGTRIRPAIRDFIKRTPKLRGESSVSAPKRQVPTIVNLRELGKRFTDGASVTPKTLVSAGLLSSTRRPVKILSDGKALAKLLVRDVAVSKAAREKIEKAGGSIE